MKIRHRTGRSAVVAALTAAALALASTAIVLPGANADVLPALAPAVLAASAPLGVVPLTPAGAPQTIPGLATWNTAEGQFTLGADAKVVGTDATLTGDLAAQLSIVLERTVATATAGPSPAMSKSVSTPPVAQHWARKGMSWWWETPSRSRVPRTPAPFMALKPSCRS